MMDAELRNQVYSDALDKFACGLAIVDGAGKLMLANAAAHALFADGQTLRLVQERVTAQLPGAARKLQALLQDALACRALRGGAIIVHGAGQQVLSVTVEAASEQFRQRTGGAAYVYISDLRARPSRASEAQVRAMFGFTPAEARIAVGIADGETLKDAATRVGVSYESARFTLKRVFEKLGVHKQGELVALVHAALPPLRVQARTHAHPAL